MRISDWSSDVCSSDLELRLARVALEQFDIERAFQRLDRMADGRLRASEFSRRTREASLVAYRNERTQLVDGDVVEHRSPENRSYQAIFRQLHLCDKSTRSVGQPAATAGPFNTRTRPKNH